MSDLVERLKARAARLAFLWRAQNAAGKSDDAELMAEAAAEIEKLRREKAEVRASYEQMNDAWLAANDLIAAANERATAAEAQVAVLWEIAELEPGTQAWVDRAEPTTAETKLLGEIFLIVRRALSDARGGET